MDWVPDKKRRNSRRKAEKQAKKQLHKRGILDFCRTVVTSMYRGAQDSHLTASDWERTILIDTAYLSALNFAMTHTQTDWLIETGSVAVVDAFSSGT